MRVKVLFVVGILLLVGYRPAAGAPAGTVGEGPFAESRNVSAARVAGRGGFADVQISRDDDVGLFSTIGVGFTSKLSDEADVRVTLADGSMTEWRTVHLAIDDGPDHGSAEGASIASAPVWVGRAIGYEIRFPADATDLSVHLVRPGRDAAPVGAAGIGTTTSDAIGLAGVNSRSVWGARTPKIHPALARAERGAQMVVVHHTFTPGNGYTAADMPKLMRDLQAYDMDVRHYDDLGYNVIVDQFGGIWEGRFGGLDQPVVGAQAKGFNEVSMGVVVIGDFVDRVPPAAVVDSVARLAAWKLTLEGYDPTSTITLNEGDTEGHPAHPFPLTLPRIVGHRDVGQTACPGKIWDALPEIRTKAAQYALEAAGDVVAVPGNRSVAIAGEVPEAEAASGVIVTVDRVVVDSIEPAAMVADVQSGTAAPIRDFTTTAAISPGWHRICAFTRRTDGLGALIDCTTTEVIDPGLNAIRPSRILDTRSETMLKRGEVRSLQVAGKGRVSERATSAVLNLTATQPATAGWLATFPCSSGVPGTTSNVNFAVGATVAGMAMVRLDASGTVCLTSNTDVHVVVDATAWFGDDTSYLAVTPERLIDTRITKKRLAAGVPLQVALADRRPPNVGSVAVNLTATAPARAGWMVVYPCDESPGGTSSANFAAGETRANLAVSKLAANGSVCVLANVATDVVIDLSGWFPTGRFHPMAPKRLLDTRLVAKGRLTDDDTIELPIRAQQGIPETATAVLVNLTATDSKQPGWLSSFPCATLWPGTSSVNFDAAAAVPNLTLTQVGKNGCLRVSTLVATDVVADAVGWFE